MPAKPEIDQFLIELKEKIRLIGIVFRPRDKNLEALANLDISAVKRLECLMNLKAEDYYAGPKKDTYNSLLPDYYEFGIQIKGSEVYIKISKGLENKPVDCMSFHAAAFTMSYPLKTT